MHSGPTKARSITTQVVVLFTVAAAVLLGCALGTLYWLVIRHAFAEDNAVLRDKIRGLRRELHEPDSLRTMDEQLNSRRAGESTMYWVRILDPESQVVAQTSQMDPILPANVFPEPSESSRSSPRDYRDRGRLFSLVSLEEPLGGKLYRVQVAQDRSEDERFRTRFGALLLCTLALGTIAFAVIALTVTRSGLRPLREIAGLVGRVGPTRLDERLPQRVWPREIQPLATAFDDMLARLQDAFTRLSQFSADLAHELRTPVANLLGEAQVALTRDRSPQEYRAIIESSVAECERLSGIIDNLLFLARAEAADGHIQRTVFDAKSAVGKILAMYEPIAEEQKITLKCEGRGEIQADPVLFERAVSNLVENAVRYTPPGGMVSVSIATRETQSEITVTDSGHGIPNEHHDHVFDRFYRVDASRNSEGAGLGLALVKSIMDLHSGSAELQSEVGRGTRVTLRFPNKPPLPLKSA